MQIRVHLNDHELWCDSHLRRLIRYPNEAFSEECEGTTRKNVRKREMFLSLCFFVVVVVVVLEYR